MSIEIYGWVETRYLQNFEPWDAAIRIYALVLPRNYEMFASLFGVKNNGDVYATEHGRFRAIAPGRGKPPGASHWYLAEREEWEANLTPVVNESWVLWSEIAAVDWNEEANDYLEDGFHHYVDANGEHHVALESQPGWRPERRGDYLTDGWATLFKLMAELAEHYAPYNIRLSVWFDGT